MEAELTNRYQGRALDFVGVVLSPAVGAPKTEHAKEHIACEVRVWLDDLPSETEGPGAKLTFDIEPMPGATMETIQRAAYEAAHELLVRMSTFDADTLTQGRQHSVNELLKPMTLEDVISAPP
jgi:hypothetical protein